MFSYVYNSNNNPGAKTVMPRVDTAPYGVETPWLVVDWLRLVEPARGESCPSGQRRTRGGQGLILGSEMLPYLYHSSSRRTKTDISRVDIAPHGVETPTPLAEC